MAFGPAAAGGGTSGIGIFRLLVGLVPCYPVFRVPPTFSRFGFPYTPSVASPAPIPLFGFSSTPLSPHSPGHHHRRRMRGACYSALRHPRTA